MSAWYYVDAGMVKGPITVDEVRGAAEHALLTPDTPVWCEGMSYWACVATIPEFMGFYSVEEREAARQYAQETLPAVPRKVPPPQAPYPIVPPQPGITVFDPPKNKVVAGLLGIFLGALGIHRFYLGYTSVGLTMLLLTVLSAFILSPIIGIWGLVEGILCLTGQMVDAHGRRLVE